MSRPATVDESLARFGIDITPTPRLENEATQAVLPDTYLPFGAAKTLNKFDELLAVGFPLTGFSVDSVLMVVEEKEDANLPGVFNATPRWTPSAASTPWAVSSGAAPTTLRAATAGDVDADGREELVFVSWSAGDAAVVVRTVQDQLSAWFNAPPLEVSTATPTSLAIASGDFNGDGRAEVVVAVATADNVQLVFLTGAGGGLALTGRTLNLAPLTVAPAIEVGLVAGNLDRDRQLELAVVVNEAYQVAGVDSGASRYWIYDDETTGFAPRRQAQRVTANPGDADRSALAASVAIGDLDGDDVGEVVLGGLTTFDPAGTCAYAYLLFALDGLDADLAPLGVNYQTSLFPPGSVCTDLRLRTVQLVAFDRDGDGGDELQANQLAFEDFRQAAPWTPVGAGLYGTEVTLHELFGGTGDTYSGEFSRATSAFAVGDVTRDKRSDLVIFSQSSAAPAVRVHAIALPPAPSSDPAAWRVAATIATPAPPAEPLWPILATANVDRDSMSIQFSQGERRVVFTEPIVIAALAAPPCADDLGQNLDSCRTSFGTATSTTIDEEFAWTVTAGLTLGAKVEVGFFVTIFEAEVAASIKASYGQKTSKSYTLTKRVTNTTGPLEDGVIFTSIPFDQYTYKILTHPIQEAEGQEIVISLPRKPIETLVERGFFNDNVPEGAIQIDDTVFSHVLGDPRSYPTLAQKDALALQHTELLSADASLDVCEGAGERSIEINLGNELGTGSTYGIETELAVQVTAGGVMAGFSIGASGENSLSISHGTETTYSGAVSCIDAAHYNPDTSYSYGLMSYFQEDPRQEFEVVNYWVE